MTTSSNWNNLPDSDKKDQLERRDIAGKLGEALAFLRISARTSYFTGYSITETLDDRIKAIGKDKKMRPKEDTNVNNPAYFSYDELKNTQLGRLAEFERKVGDAVEAALKLEQ